MAKTIFKRNEIMLLLGAGASVEAGIPDSNNMVHELEVLVSSDNEQWSEFRDLYRYIRSSIFYADGLEGKFGSDVPYNIERLVNVLDELQKKERHPLYPFVGAWNPKLLDVAGTRFDNVFKFRSNIIHRLRNEWIVLPEKENAIYYSSLLEFQEEYQHPLRVFSLNYDLCVERVCGQDKVQRGFSQRTWDWRLFDETSDDSLPILLYKLHGSMDWGFNDVDGVSYSDDPNNISDEKIAIIFGDSYKLQYVDPFLFLAYELRRRSLDARLIVAVGYGFNDDHINAILQQSLRQDDRRKLLAIVGPRHDSNGNTEKSLSEKLDVQDDQIVVKSKGAKEFFDTSLTISSLADLFPSEVDLILELPDLDTDQERGQHRYD